MKSTAYEVCLVPDEDRRKQCQYCGMIYPRYEAKIESKLKDIAEPSNDPFGHGKKITGLGNKKPKSSYDRQRQEKSVRIDKEKDLEIKRELRKGNVVEIIRIPNIHLWVV